MILDLIQKNQTITQRKIANHINVAVSLVNNYLSLYEREGLIIRKKYSSKNVEYFITRKGIENKKILNIGYLNLTKKLYFKAKDDFEKFLIQISNKGFKNILLYGAGEVAEMLLHTITTTKKNIVIVLAVIDDNPDKVGKKIGNYSIISNKYIKNFNHDGILISTYTRKDEIKMKLLDMNYQQSKIIEFFE